MQTNFHSKYKVQCKIGEGSFSEVLKCQDKLSGLCVAAKQLKKTCKSATKVSDIPEVVAMRKLTIHENIIQMLEIHYDPLSGKVTLIFELMDMSLYDLMNTRKKPFSELKSRNFLYQIVKGVEHVHQHGIFHRDIKPENILVKGDLLKISDLGSIKGIYANHPYTEYIATRWYRSPECLLTTGYYGPKMDIWAIGCVFYELLTLKPLFPGSSELDQVAKINGVLGTPNTRVLAKFRKGKLRNMPFNFGQKQGTGLNQLMPVMSEAGRDVIRQMITYDPDLRTNIRRLIEHKYFSDIRDAEYLQKMVKLSRESSFGSMNKINIKHNPVLFSHMSMEQRARPKRKLSTISKDRRLEAKPSKKLVAPMNEAIVQHDSFTVRRNVVNKESNLSLAKEHWIGDRDRGMDALYKLKHSLTSFKNHSPGNRLSEMESKSLFKNLNLYGARPVMIPVTTERSWGVKHQVTKENISNVKRNDNVIRYQRNTKNF